MHCVLKLNNDMKINFKHYILICLAICSVVISGVGYWFVYDRVIKQAKTYSSGLQNISLENNKKQHINEVAKAYNDTLEDRNKITNFLLNDDKIVGLIETIESIGENSSSNVTISGINNEDLSSAEKGTFGHLIARIDAKGTWVNIMRALIMIENLSYSISINNLNLISEGGESASSKTKIVKNDNWKLSFDISVLTIK